MSRLKELKEKAMTWFFGFWIKHFRISYLIILWIIVIWSVSLINIPKESSPEVNLWMITVTTIYPGANPNDVDSLVTDKIYKEIKDIKGIDKIDSTSSIWASMLAITLKTWIDSKDVVNDVRNNINRISLPDDAKDPIVTEVDTDTKQIFSVYLYPKNPDTSKDLVLEKANILKNKLEKVSGVESVKFANWSIGVNIWAAWNLANEYDINILIDPDKVKNSGLNINSIASTIQSWNKDIPIWNFTIWEKNYDFRVEWKYKDALSMLDIPLQLKNWTYIKLGDIATIERKYKDKSINLVWQDSTDSFPYISLVVNKNEWASVFWVSKTAKEKVSEIFNTKEFNNYSYIIWNDLSDMINEDYKSLAREALITLSLVFFVMFLFVWLKDSIFATLTLPLAFLCTFIILYSFGYSLNFLTNFSLILSFWIAIDTIIVIIQAASAKARVWYDPDIAILLALREYSKPLSAWVLTTIVAFVPMMFLPWIMWKFLAYIPITIFWVLAFGLILVLTVNSSLYLLFVKKKKTYIHDDTAIEYASDEEKELLNLEREWKTEINKKTIPFRVKIITSTINWYKDVLSKFLTNTFIRRISILLPVLFLIFWFIFLAPMIKVELFPSADNWYITASIEWENWITTEKMYNQVSDIWEYLKKYKEIRLYSININENIASITIELKKKWEREDLWLMTAFQLEKELEKDLKNYEKKWLKTTSTVIVMWPPTWSAIWLNLVAENYEQLDTLIDVSKDFEKNLKSINWTKWVTKSSKDTPWQFVFTLKKEVLWVYNIPPAIVYSHIIQMMNWISVWSIEDNWTDMNIYVKQSNFVDKINVEDIVDSTFNYWWKEYIVWNFIEYNAKNAIQSIVRKDWKININVWSDVEEWADRVAIQNKFEEYAKSYNFPNWIYFEKWWENEENKDLIIAVFSSFFIAVLIIFAILTLQFNSFTQPMIILYSVIMATPFVFLGLILTNNPFSVPFWIWFISFTWIAVNHWIILIDAININLNKWMSSFKALIEAWTSRLEPMTLTTLTTSLWILPIALKDKFWAWMWFTIIFWIIAASFLTLFVLKWVYYEVYLRREKNLVK